MNYVLGQQPLLTEEEYSFQPMVDLTEDYVKELKPDYKGKFYAAIYPVNHNQWTQFCVDTGRMLPDDNGFGRGELPVASVQNIQILEYCNWLNRKSKVGDVDPEHECAHMTMYEYNVHLGLPGDVYVIEGSNVKESHPDCKGFRIPFKDEWEFMKGDAEEQEKELGRDAIAIHPDNSGGKPSVPGTKLPNNRGLYDMIGLMLEMCVDYVNNK